MFSFKFVSKATYLWCIRRRVSSSTIFALSSGHGKCGVAVIRVSGSNTSNALKIMTKLKKLPTPRTAILRSIRHPTSKEILDKGLVLWFPGPNSFTGEDSCEFHIHGGIAVINGVLDGLGTLPNMKLAEPGQFTKRAFLNGKLDLTEVEGLADLLQAETELQRKQAFLQTNGSLSRLYQKWKQMLIQSIAHLEAHIDFEETETLEYGLVQSVVKNVNVVVNELELHLKDGRKGELLRNGVRTIILGEPNVGKSSLLNLLCQRPVSIVTPISGTTRDIIEVTLNVKGYPLILLDTAGLRGNSSDVIEIEGISRAIDTFKNSDLVILVVDFEKYLDYTNYNPSSTFQHYLCRYVTLLGIPDFVHNSFQNNLLKSLFKKPCIVVVNKTDLDHNNLCKLLDSDIIKMSCKTESGVGGLVNILANQMEELCGKPSQEHPSMNQMRHREQLSKCLENLNVFLTYSKKMESADLVIMAEYLRKSLKHLGNLLGSVTSEEILDVIFKDFCIGK